MTRPSWWRRYLTRLTASPRHAVQRPAERDVTGWLPVLHPCSCTGSRVVVIHDPGTPCGHQQHDHVGLAALDAAARAGACSDDMHLIDVAVTAVLDSLTDSKEKP